VRQVQVAFTKWGGTPHWTFDGRRLGEDEHGVWVGCAPPLVIRRPRAEVRFDVAAVQLFPHGEPWTLAAYAHSPALQYELYVDITTPPVWTGDTVTMIDLDLDVIREWDGTVTVLDEDEFAVHQIELNYPAELIELATRSCTASAAAIRAGAEPFASDYRGWLAQVA